MHLKHWSSDGVPNLLIKHWGFKISSDIFFKVLTSLACKDFDSLLQGLGLVHCLRHLPFAKMEKKDDNTDSPWILHWQESHTQGSWLFFYDLGDQELGHKYSLSTCRDEAMYIDPPKPHMDGNLLYVTPFLCLAASPLLCVCVLFFLSLGLKICSISWLCLTPGIFSYFNVGSGIWFKLQILNTMMSFLELLTVIW